MKVIEAAELGHHEPSGKIRLGLGANFLAILELELAAMVVRLIRPLKLAGVHGDRWTVRLVFQFSPGFSIDVGCPSWRLRKFRSANVDAAL